jgi:hypothetical protein
VNGHLMSICCCIRGQTNYFCVIKVSESHNQITIPTCTVLRKPFRLPRYRLAMP